MGVEKPTFIMASLQNTDFQVELEVEYGMGVEKPTFKFRFRNIVSSYIKIHTAEYLERR